MDATEIHDADPSELVAGAELLASCLGFADRDAIPAWLMLTATSCGGVALSAIDGGRLVGFSFAIAADDGSLFSCGLAVAASHRGRHLARGLKLAQRDRALARGITSIRWTADPLAAPALAVYLTGLGARLEAYEPELYASVRPAPVPPDDVVIRWDLAGARRVDQGSGTDIEIPFAHADIAVEERSRWRLRVRERMCSLLDEGFVGTGVTFDRASRRCWVRFAREV